MANEEQSTTEEDLPSRQELFHSAGAAMAAAREQVSDAEAWLRADWRPTGTALSEQQADARAKLAELCIEIRARMEHATQILQQATDPNPAESGTDES